MASIKNSHLVTRTRSVEPRKKGTQKSGKPFRYLGIILVAISLAAYLITAVFQSLKVEEAGPRENTAEAAAVRLAREACTRAIMQANPDIESSNFMEGAIVRKNGEHWLVERQVMEKNLLIFKRRGVFQCMIAEDKKGRLKVESVRKIR